ncbi:uncharacterized protein LOC129565299 [Sitodiplosis mosellana]|uniref:uncharacterized protein LOC129565299 n=1 Tax=Sitodiplosis mosellana TaxID=263140 RepID=UPI0024452DB9|nr:uncharacterized protein LOC129565299 [Sitodiplosis mosellana]XP_055296005.1 uncharacterized protein LOC129565299 [Sitodiplosis mosellana]XP_055296006.1 uncharacterized protein LOC129565299 [Sitodiplosis mosellana]
MEDSIINIDDESDSFSLSSDTDIRNIVDQWKRNHETTESKDLKYLDTRTFTRPKKKSSTYSDVNDTNFLNREKTSSDELSDDQMATSSSSAVPVPRIDLKIGGLVTSLQRSLLGDVSPPSHMDNSMGNSLITSNDFSNIDFMNDTGDSLSMAHFKHYRLSDAIADRNFLERLTNYDESLFTKDADINNVDLIENGNCTGSSSSTLQNSTDSTNNLGGGKHDGTFNKENLVNGTFDASGEVDKTFIQAPDANGSMNASIRNSTFEMGNKANRTFETQVNKMNITIPVVADYLDDEELALCNSLNGTQILDMNSTFQLDEYQSTPAAQVRKSRKSESLQTISPIFSERNKNNLTQNVDKFVDIEIEDIPVYLREPVTKSTARASNPTGINTEMVENERQSLANFEEFENTLLILENNKTEEEFDDLLNSFSAKIRNPMSQKVRQSLDNIKKRHSSMGMEKQQQDELNRETAMNTSKNGKYSEFGSNEKNRLNDSLSRSVMNSSTSSGSGERLLRRSRLFDDALSTYTDRIVDNSGMDHSGSSIGYTDNKQANELNSTQTLNMKNQLYLEQESAPKTEPIYNTEESHGESKSNNRDRFKTIRIFKKPPQNAIQIPGPEETYIQAMQSPLPVARTGDVFATKNTNSPKQHGFDDEQNQATAKGINTMTFKRSGLARPRQLGGLAKRDLYAKSNSQEFLSSDEPNGISQSKPVQQIKSPMGIKSKSIHNLSTAKHTSKLPGSRVDIGEFEHPSSTRNSALSSHTFKIPAQKSSAAVMRQRLDVGQSRKLSLIRPSSGYYGYNTKRTDSDTDLGRFSSNNSLSSGSSKSSLSRGETPETFTASNENPNATFVQPSAKTSNVPSRSSAVASSGIVAPKASMLRPPSQIRRSALPRPAAFSTKR